MAFPGLLEGLHRLAVRHPVWVVSGNAPGLLAFKTAALGLDPRIPQLGSLPRHDRPGLLRRALEGCPGPHLYLGDRPHDRAAAEAAGIPFLGVGSQVPGPHPVLPEDASADAVAAAVAGALAPSDSPSR